MKPTVEQIENLLAQRRDERPEEGYWQDFICEFHQKQRERSVKGYGFSAFFSRISGWFTEVGPSKWAYGAGVAYATAAIALLVVLRDSKEEQVAPTPVNFQVIPAPEPPAIEQLKQLDLNPSTQGDIGEHVF